MNESKHEETEIIKATPMEVTPADLLSVASSQAKVLVDLIEKQGLYVTISGRKYVKVEGWVPLARMNHVIPSEITNEEIPEGSGRYVAVVELVRLDDGKVLTRASGECGGPGEPKWQERPPYARRSMAATRATGKACRMAYSWIMALGGYEPTPAEEMDGVNHNSVVPPPPAKPFTGEVPYTQTDNAPDTYWMFVKKGVRKIGVVAGDCLTPDVLVGLGMNEWKGKWYADWSEGLEADLNVLRGAK